MYFTNWGKYMTLFTFILGIMAADDDVEPLEELNYADESYI